jgi:hypothetical protein
MIPKSRVLRNTLAVLWVVAMVGMAFAADERGLPANLDLKGSDVYFSSATYQSNIQGDKDLGTLAAAHPAIADQAIAYGFAAKSDEAKFFIIGSLYAEALAYLRSDNTDLAVKRLEAIEKELIALRAPNSLYNYISKTRNLIETNRYPGEILGEFLALLQPFCEDYAQSRGEDKLTLFRAGSWLVNLSLTAAAQDKAMLQQPAKVHYFTVEMKRLDAPKGVLDALDKITTIVEKKEVTDADLKEVLKLVKQIQTILA